MSVKEYISNNFKTLDPERGWRRLTEQELNNAVKFINIRGLGTRSEIKKYLFYSVGLTWDSQK